MKSSNNRINSTSSEQMSTGKLKLDLENDNNNTINDEDDDDKFYDHDQILSTNNNTTANSSSAVTPISSTDDVDLAITTSTHSIDYSNLNRQFETTMSANNTYHTYNHNNNDLKSVEMKKRRRRSMLVTITFMFVGVCIVLFAITIVQYSACNLTSSSVSIASGQCQYSRIVSRLNDNLSAINRRLWSVVGSTGAYQWISWPIYSPNTSESPLSLDPLFSWFFRQYQPN